MYKAPLKPFGSYFLPGPLLGTEAHMESSLTTPLCLFIYFLLWKQEWRAVKQCAVYSCTGCSQSKTPWQGGEWRLKFSPCLAPQAICTAMRLDLLNKKCSSFQFAQRYHPLCTSQTMNTLGCACSGQLFLILTRCVGTTGSGSESRKLDRHLFSKDYEK